MPPYWVITSLGRCAEPDGRFSAAGTRPVTLTRTPRSRSADIVAITAPPAAMSVFIAIMPAFGLRESPPESNVMPFADQDDMSVDGDRRIGCVGQLDQTRRARRAHAHRDDAAEALGAQLAVVAHP